MSEKTEDATPKRVRKARRDGDVAKSAEFTGTMVMITAFAISTLTLSTIASALMALMARAIELAVDPSIDAKQAAPFILEALREIAPVMAPLLAGVCAAAALVTYLQVGALFTIKPLTPDANKLNPVQGAKNIVHKDKLVDLVKNVLKLALMIGIGAQLLWDVVPQLTRVPRAGIAQGIDSLAAGFWRITGALIAGLIVFAVFDLVWQRHKHAKKLKMSKDEVKREYKESEGDPMLKGKRKQLHQEMLRDASIARTKKADAVVVNPTHIAVALAYDADTMSAPTILTSGRGERAKQIKALARKHNIPIVRQVPLARALIELDVDQEIPSDLYDAVAETLRFVYALRAD
ncbi:MAG: EscU/YscU/HrcU family type III secretion system export apparatus switch protein [Myxococcota bacterium]